jgi:hypothetical protein
MLPVMGFASELDPTRTQRHFALTITWQIQIKFGIGDVTEYCGAN